MSHTNFRWLPLHDPIRQGKVIKEIEHKNAHIIAVNLWAILVMFNVNGRLIQYTHSRERDNCIWAGGGVPPLFLRFLSDIIYLMWSNIWHVQVRERGRDQLAKLVQSSQPLYSSESKARKTWKRIWNFRWAFIALKIDTKFWLKRNWNSPEKNKTNLFSRQKTFLPFSHGELKRFPLKIKFSCQNGAEKKITHRKTEKLQLENFTKSWQVWNFWVVTALTCIIVLALLTPSALEELRGKCVKKSHVILQ